MKKLTFILALSFLGNSSFSQENDSWRWGVQLGMQGSKSDYIGGGADANARFNHNEFGSGALNFIVRYDLNNHWKLESGLGFSSVGFEDVIAENYSFLTPSNRYTKVNSSVGMLEVPLMVSYKFNPNCKNWKWFISGGLASVYVGGANKSSEATKTNDGPTNVVYLSNTANANEGTYLHLRFAAGREKVFQSGRIFSWSFIWNAGFNQLATSTVKYTIDAQSYQHEFGTNGNFFGFRLAYLFKPINNTPAKIKPSAALTN